ncbi:MAG TPA: dihydrolipoyl dehydrogenase [Clostridia bacterium]|nr:dihydrolipoyl dehydrogenase [Clostridia bacterium]
MKDYQLLIIGAGPGGYAAALRASELGLRTAVVENREAGGTCLHRGCVPTKALLHSAQVYHEICAGGTCGISAQAVQINMEAMFAHKRQVSEKLSSGIRSMLKSAKVDWIAGTGTILSSDTVQVTGEEGACTYTTDEILVATGSVPAHLPIPGLELPGVMTSDELLEGCDHLYRSIVIIGGGVIGVEFATFYNDLGCEVTIIEGMDRLLPAMDRELGQNLTLILKKRGVKISTGAMVQNVARGEQGLIVHFMTKDVPAVATGEVVLCAIGRRPCLDGVFADGLKPEMNGRSLRVDERYQTSIPHVYAIGDVSSKVQLAHVATAQGSACVSTICGRENSVDMDVVPSCIYSRPEIAVVGVTEQEAKETGISAKCGKCVMFGNARTVIMNGDRCFMKVVARTDDHRIIGAQLMCQNSTDIISEIAQAIANRMTVEQLVRAIRPHPTFEEALTEALQDLLTKLGN